MAKSQADAQNLRQLAQNLRTQETNFTTAYQNFEEKLRGAYSSWDDPVKYKFEASYRETVQRIHDRLIQVLPAYQKHLENEAQVIMAYAEN